MLRTWTLIALAALVAGCADTGFGTTSSFGSARADRSLDNESLCQFATRAGPGGLAWDGYPNEAYVDQAQRRGLSLATCRTLLRGGTQAANIRALTNKQLCAWAVKDFRWQVGFNREPHVAEAKRRGLTPRTCMSSPDAPTEVAAAAPSEPTRRSTTPASRDTTKPIIQVPAVVATSTGEYEIAGRVIDESEIAEVRLFGEAVAVSRSGGFRVSAFAAVGSSEVEIEAIDVWGNRATRTIVVTRTVGAARPAAEFAALNPRNVSVRPNPNAVAIIVGLESYQNAPTASYADRDAQYFVDYAIRALGVPEHNIKLLVNDSAGLISIKSTLKQWLPAMAGAGGADVYLFFAGHGLASADGDRLFLLPFDANIGLLEDSALVREEVFAALANAAPSSVTVFLDTCFSGGTRTQDMLVADARGLRVSAKANDLPDNFTVLSAAANDQISSSLPETKHGLFSYFLMRGLEGEADADGDRRITTGELYDYITNNVPREAIRLGRTQNPQLAGDPDRVIVRM